MAMADTIEVSAVRGRGRYFSSAARGRVVGGALIAWG
ncbi:hypothetical protein FHX81_6972 [Saccharothrix saharensis]|uniref:Uncharacterized protein n=1 Tax=Saccharothrix saharensis TaxID=571190 RepID=A0A543JNW3_9PSEU|nr:hypothetical protein FHX81_6972 [Saccharothrix saharensis]